MPVDWKKILLEGDAAEPSDASPQSVGTTPEAGTGTKCSRADHVHDIGAGAIDASDLFVAGVVDETALGPDVITGEKIADDAVGSEHIGALSANLDFAGNQATDLALHSVADAAARDALTPVFGKVVWQTDQLHPFICVATE